MRLIRQPFRPQWTPFMIEAFSLRRHKEWLPFLSGGRRGVLEHRAGAGIDLRRAGRSDRRTPA